MTTMAVSCNSWVLIAAAFNSLTAAVTSQISTPGIVREYCQADNFEAACDDHSVIVMQTAQYGRMRQGRCVKGDYGLLGCKVDAVQFMDAECSGRKQCKFRVFDSPLREQGQCPTDMASYLEANYTCQTVTQADQSQCLRAKPVVLMASSASLSSTTSEDTGVGTADCPWLIQALPGQRIVVSLRYFGHRHSSTGGSSSGGGGGGGNMGESHSGGALVGGAAAASSGRKLSMSPSPSLSSSSSSSSAGLGGGSGGGGCYELATVRETIPPTVAGDGSRGAAALPASATGSEFRSITTCDGRMTGEHEIYRSTSHQLTLTVIGRNALKSVGKFIIGYRAFGCADKSTPFNATMIRDGDRLTVKCNRSDHIWYLVCVNDTWQGDEINCNTGDSGAWKMRPMFDVSSFPYGILVVVAVGVALGIFCGGLLLACVVVYMKSERRQQLRRDDYMQSATDFRCSVDGYYGTSVREPRDLQAPPPLLSASEEELNEKAAAQAAVLMGGTTLPSGGGFVHLAGQTCLSPTGGRNIGPRSVSATVASYAPSSHLIGADLCADCCAVAAAATVASDYDRRGIVKPNKLCHHGVDVTMTTNRLQPHTHVYELPHVV